MDKNILDVYRLAAPHARPKHASHRLTVQ